MKKQRVISIVIMAALVIGGLTVAVGGSSMLFSGCREEAEMPEVPKLTPKTVTFGSNSYNIAIDSSDEHLPSTWIKLCNDVVTALNTAYAGGNEASQDRFGVVFGGGGVKIVLVNNLGNNWEVRDGEFRTLYLKTGSIATADYSIAVRRMNTESPDVGKVNPTKNGTFLALA